MVFVLTCTSALNWLCYHYILVPLDLVYLRFIVFIVVIAAFVQVVEMIIERVSERLYNALGIFLPLITVNCAILGVSLFMVIREYTLAQALGYGLGSGIGWVVAILAMAGTKPGDPDREPLVVQPDQEAHNAYSRVYADYRKLGDFLAS